MPRAATIADIASHEGSRVLMRGWVAGCRSSGRIAFLELRDGTGFMQCVLRRDAVDEGIFRRARKLGQESSVELTGTVRADARSKAGFELLVDGLEVVQEVRGYPISPKPHGTAFLHARRHLWLRSRRPHAVLSIRALCVRAIRDYLDDRGFVLLDSPIFTPSACEGTTTLFGTEYFGRTAWLSQSGQLYQEAGAMAFRRTYCFGPTFRAEKSGTRRHLSEFWMVEPEVAWADLDAVMDLVEDFVVEVVGRVIERGRRHLELLERDLAPLERVRKPFPRISYDQACAMLAERGLPLPPGDDFGAPHETAIGDAFDRPVLVHRFPAAIKAFYMKLDPARPDRALGVDLIGPEGSGELIGGGQREDDLEALQARIRAEGLPQEAFDWFLDLRRYGTCPHGGFGLGLERFVAWICGIHRVQEAIPFPRTIDRLEP